MPRTWRDGGPRQRPSRACSASPSSASPADPPAGLWRALPEVAAEAAEAIAATRADQLWVPAFEGGNPDHDALNAVGHRLASRLGAPLDATPCATGAPPPPVLEFAEYNFAGGRARAQSFPDPDGHETTLCLSAAESAAKRAALAAYASERSNLGYVGTARECFRPLAARDYSQRPHPGTLWYQRFGWVPVRHPRLDRTDPDEVSAAIIAFLAQR